MIVDHVSPPEMPPESSVECQVEEAVMEIGTADIAVEESAHSEEPPHPSTSERDATTEDAMEESDAHLPPYHEQESDDSDDAKDSGLLQYRKWWFMREVALSVNGRMIEGTPVFLRKGALRVIGEAHSYFVPMAKIDYIRTADGYGAIRSYFEESLFDG